MKITNLTTSTIAATCSLPTRDINLSLPPEQFLSIFTADEIILKRENSDAPVSLELRSTSTQVFLFEDVLAGKPFRVIPGDDGGGDGTVTEDDRGNGGHRASNIKLVNKIGASLPVEVNDGHGVIPLVIGDGFTQGGFAAVSIELATLPGNSSLRVRFFETI